MTRVCSGGYNEHMKNLKYDLPNQYSRLYRKQLGQDLWEFMKRPENIKLMEDGTAQELPAVELLTSGLLAKFNRQKIEEDHVKKMIGDMALQIMRFLGYEPDKKIDTQDDRLFSSGTRYRKKQ